MEQNIQNGVQEPFMRIEMFGGFSMTYDGNRITFARSSNTKFIQLLQLLFFYYHTGISKKKLLDALYDWEDGGSPNKNLNNVIYRLKKQLASAGLPKEECIHLEDGICRGSAAFR